MASNITLQQYHKRIQLWCLFQLTQIDHNYPYISYYPTKTAFGIVTASEKTNVSNRMQYPEYPYKQTDYFPYISKDSKEPKQPSSEMFEQESNVNNGYANLPYHLSSQALRMLMIESSAPRYEATLNNSQFSEEAKDDAEEYTKEYAKESLEQLDGMKE